MDGKWIERLRCPTTHQALKNAGAEEIDFLNRKIASGQCVNRSGKKITTSFEAGLLTADGRLFYPVTSGIPIMLPDEAVELTSGKDA